MARPKKTSEKQRKPSGFKFEFYISIEGGAYVPLDSLTTEERNRAEQKLVENFGKAIERSLCGQEAQWLALCEEGTLVNA